MTAAPEIRADADPVTVAELAVLGSVVAAADAAAEAIAARLEARHFRHPAHAAVYAAVLRLAAAPEPVVEPTAVIGELAGALDDDGGPGGAVFVRCLAEHAGPVRHHAPKVIAAWRRRNLRGALALAADVAEGDGWDDTTGPARIRDLIDQAAAAGAPGALGDPVQMLDAAIQALQDGADPAMSTGYPELDEVTGGLTPETMTIIAARTGGGKTMLGLCMAEHVATELEMPVLYSSLEMNARQLGFRRMASAARVSLKRLVRYEPTDIDWDKIGNVYPNLAGSRLRIDDAPSQSIATMAARLAEMAAEGTPAAAHVLDYVQLATPSDLRISREQQVSELARQYRELARRHKFAGVMLAQLNRGPEHRRGGRPQLSDLRESGSLEQHADVVILLHREVGRDGELSGDVWAIVAKNRQGPTAEVKLNFQGHFGRIGSNVHPWTPHTVVD